MFIDDDALVEILNKLDDSINEMVAKQNFTDWREMEKLLDVQYESHLANTLRSKANSFEDLEPKKKNMIIDRKRRLFSHLKQTFQKTKD